MTNKQEYPKGEREHQPPAVSGNPIQDTDDEILKILNRMDKTLSSIADVLKDIRYTVEVLRR